MISWSEHTPGNAKVVVDGEIMSDTVIMGLHSKLVPDKELCHVRIVECPVKKDNGGEHKIIYQMQADDF